VTPSAEAAAVDALRVGDHVGLSFPARGDLVVLARLVASAISSRAGFDIEELEDLRLAVGELCLLALQGTDTEHGHLRLEFTVSDDAIDISCTLEGAAPSLTIRGEEAEADQLSQQILSALVDDYGRHRDDGSVKAWLRKQRRGHSA
jgi:serine/threonine-protein kinase RsbW